MLALLFAILVASLPVVLLIVVCARPYGLTLYGYAIVIGLLLAALSPLALVFSPNNRFVEFDQHAGVVRLGPRFGLGRATVARFADT